MNTLLASAQKSKSFKLAISKKLSMSISDELRGKMRFSTSEPVASYIIDKVISYAITEVNKNITHTKVNQKCTEFTLGFISSLVSGDRIYFEEDDLNINQSNCCDEKSRSFNYSNKSVSDQIEIDEDNKPSTSIYYDQHKSTCHNHWNEISCPKVSQIDAYESSKIKYEPLFVKPKKNRGSKKLLTTLSKTPKKIFNKISTEQRNLQINPINENATYESESARKYSNEDRSRRDLKINSQKSPNYPLTTQSKITLKSSLSG